MLRRVSKSMSCFALLILIPAIAASSTAPTTPTYLLKWGGFGDAPGQVYAPEGVATDALGNSYVTDTQNHRVQKFDRLGNFITLWGGFGSGNGQFANPYGVAVDKSGNVYVSDANHRIQKFTANGGYLAQWGSSGSGNGQFSYPVALTIDGAGYVYVADLGNDRIQKFTSAGAFVTKWGTPGTGPGQFDTVNDVAVGPDGTVYAVDYWNSRVTRFTSDGTFISQWGSTGTGNGQFQEPGKIATDGVGNVYVCEAANHRVQKFTSSGTYLTKWGSFGIGNGQFNAPFGLDVDAAGNILVSEYSGNRIQKFSGAGVPLSEPAATYLLKWGSGGSGNGQFNLPRNIAFDAAGNVYVDDVLNHRIQKFSGTGTYLSQWGSFGTGNGQFNGPEGIAVDAVGNILVVDGSNNRIQKFNSSGGYITQWGSSGSGNGQFNSPYGVAVDVGGNVFVSDNLNHRIQKFTSSMVYVTQWGTFGTGNGQFSGPLGIAVDRGGNVYVVDNGNSRIQVFSSTGSYIAQWFAGFGPAGIAIDAAGYVYLADTGNSMVRKYTGTGIPLATWGSGGTGNGQFIQPWGIGVDAAGNVYVGDSSNHRVQKFIAPASVALVSDVGNDQGRQSMLRIQRCSADVTGSGAPITGYEVYRRNDPLPGAARAAIAPGDPPNDTLLAGWTYLVTMPAHTETEYNVVVPTLVDATAASLEYSAFMVRAATADPGTFYDSATENGYSIDNLPPPAPAPLTAAYASGATHLHWGLSPAADFATFRVYRGSNSNFIPGDGNRIATNPDTGYADPGAAGSWYKVTAVDINGNESLVAVVGPGQTTDTPAAESAAFALHSAWPNPSRGDKLFVRFALPSSAPASLELIDITGRRVVARAVGTLGAGPHTLDLAEGKHLAPGIYLVRLTQGVKSGVTRIAVLD